MKAKTTSKQKIAKQNIAIIALISIIILIFGSGFTTFAVLSKGFNSEVINAWGATPIINEAPKEPEAPVNTATYAVGDAVKDLYFDTTIHPDLSKLDWSKSIPYGGEGVPSHGGSSMYSLPVNTPILILLSEIEMLPTFCEMRDIAIAGKDEAGIVFAWKIGGTYYLSLGNGLGGYLYYYDNVNPDDNRWYGEGASDKGGYFDKYGRYSFRKNYEMAYVADDQDIWNTFISNEPFEGVLDNMVEFYSNEEVEKLAFNTQINPTFEELDWSKSIPMGTNTLDIPEDAEVFVLMSIYNFNNEEGSSLNRVLSNNYDNLASADILYVVKFQSEISETETATIVGLLYGEDIFYTAQLGTENIASWNPDNILNTSGEYRIENIQFRQISDNQKYWNTFVAREAFFTPINTGTYALADELTSLSFNSKMNPTFDELDWVNAIPAGANSFDWPEHTLISILLSEFTAEEIANAESYSQLLADNNLTYETASTLFAVKIAPGSSWGTDLYGMMLNLTPLYQCSLDNEGNLDAKWDCINNLLTLENSMTVNYIGANQKHWNDFVANEAFFEEPVVPARSMIAVGDSITQLAFNVEIKPMFEELDWTTAIPLGVNNMGLSENALAYVFISSVALGDTYANTISSNPGAKIIAVFKDATKGYITMGEGERNLVCLYDSSQNFLEWNIGYALNIDGTSKSSELNFTVAYVGDNQKYWNTFVSEEPFIDINEIILNNKVNTNDTLGGFYLNKNIIPKFENLDWSKAIPMGINDFGFDTNSSVYVFLSEVPLSSTYETTLSDNNKSSDLNMLYVVRSGDNYTLKFGRATLYTGSLTAQAWSSSSSNDYQKSIGTAFNVKYLDDNQEFYKNFLSKGNVFR